MAFMDDYRQDQNVEVVIQPTPRLERLLAEQLLKQTYRYSLALDSTRDNEALAKSAHEYHYHSEIDDVIRQKLSYTRECDAVFADKRTGIFTAVCTIDTEEEIKQFAYAMVLQDNAGNELACLELPRVPFHRDIGARVKFKIAITGEKGCVYYARDDNLLIQDLDDEVTDMQNDIADLERRKADKTWVSPQISSLESKKADRSELGALESSMSAAIANAGSVEISRAKSEGHSYHINALDSKSSNRFFFYHFNGPVEITTGGGGITEGEGVNGTNPRSFVENYNAGKLGHLDVGLRIPITKEVYDLYYDSAAVIHNLQIVAQVIVDVIHANGCRTGFWVRLVNGARLESVYGLPGFKYPYFIGTIGTLNFSHYHDSPAISIAPRQYASGSIMGAR